MTPLLKSNLRTALLSRRKELSPGEIRLSSNQVFQNFEVHVQEHLPASFEFIALYSPIQGEVETQSFFRHFFKQGKHCCYPKVTETGLSFHAVSSLENLQVGGAFNVPEPKGTNPPVKPDLMIVPGVGFSLQGNRLGFGKGYYDRVIEKISPRPYLIGLGFDFQVIEDFPAEPHDQKVDLIITEKRVVLCQR